MSRTLLLSALLGLFVAPGALAQPDPSAAPVAGTVAVAAGAAPSPFAVDLTVGGAEEAADASAECVGYVSAAPSIGLDYTGRAGRPLYLFARSSTDTVLLVQTPGGDWLCNDDDGSTNPGIFMEDPESGRYTVWIGTFSDMGGADVPVTLYAAEDDKAELNPDATPAGGAMRLAAGFTPDPHEMSVAVGGPTSAAAYDGCNGFVDASAPNVALDYDADGSGPLYIYAQAEGDDDLTLVVIHDDEVYCNDDADGLNPGLMIDEATAGRYAIWVGTFASGARTEAAGQARLFLSETDGPVAEEYFDDYEDYDDGTYEGGEAISLFAPPAHGTLELRPGFGSETVPVRAGGADAVSVSGFGCAGFIANGEPDLNVLYAGGGETLAFYVDAEDDTTLLVNLPDGSWRCSDDAPDMGRNPAIAVEAPEGGLYNVWVGTYTQDGSGPAATLTVGESLPD
jgi:hypothetical protein